ncbi:MAG: cupin domain-containing protein [Solirubrobacterales bacterium]|nr:cupin domain-containing protein [Solirubrobacterales bacterium]
MTDRSYWFLGGRSTVLLGAEDTEGRCAVLHHELPAGTESPAHVQPGDDEAVVVLEGEVELWLDGERRALGAGEATLVPRGTQHALRVAGGEPARLITVSTPGGHERLVALGGHPVDEHDEPPALDLERFTRAAEAAGVEILGPGPF